MYNVLIVDDEEKIREGLRNYINWNELGINLTGVAQSAEEAIRIIESECVDILLTDIVMDGNNGLELIKEALKINPFIKSVILSGYDEFAYAKEAIKLGTFDYLNKPFNLSELVSIFDKLKLVLDKEKNERIQQKELNLFSHEKFLNNLVNGYYTDSNVVIRKAEEIGIKLYNDQFCVIRVYLKQVTNDEKSTYDEYLSEKQSISELSQEYLNKIGKAYIFNNNLQEIAILFYPISLTSIQKELSDFLENLQKKINLPVYMGVGKIYISTSDARNSYSEAGKALEYRVIRKQNNSFFYEEIAEFFKGRSMITPQIEADILEKLMNQELDDLQDYIKKLLLDFYNDDLSNKSIFYDISIELFIIINNYLTNTFSIEDIKSIRKNDYNELRSLLQKDSYDGIKDFMFSYLKDCSAVINNNKEKSLGIIIENVRKYINEHYSEDINLNKLSKVAFVNPSYLSKLFKEKTGENFIDYLTKVRIEKSIKLLSDPSLRLYDISEMVGYESARHFSKVFKDFMGMNPKDYRNNLL